MWTKFQKILKSETFRYFTRYFSVFSLIFLIMTIIILQIMNTSLYQSTDERLLRLAENPAEIINLARVRSVFGNSSAITLKTSKEPEPGDSALEMPQDTQASPTLHLNTSNNAILFDQSKTVLNDNDPVLGLEQITVNFEEIGVIKEVQVKNAFDTIDNYRYVLVNVKEGVDSDKSIKYAMALINTSQLKSATEANQKIVIIVMVSFWLVSILASLGLTLITIRPIREAYEKQKAFVENASHELRTPLTVLQNRLETLFRKPEATIMDEFESIASSLDEVRNMRILTSNLLNMARRDGQFVANIEEISPDFFETTFSNYQLVAEENGKIFVGKNLVKKTFKSDPTLLKQLLTIMFDNAVKYTNQDGEIQIMSRLRDRTLLISVEDNGIGISNHDKERIFERFYRVDKARTRKSGGLGLGLSLAKQIVDGLGGQITVQDRLPKGTIFEIKLPL